MAMLLLIYVGVEISLGSWISAYMGISAGTLPQVGAWITSAYWAALAVGRLAGAAASARLPRACSCSRCAGRQPAWRHRSLHESRRRAAPRSCPWHGSPSRMPRSTPPRSRWRHLNSHGDTGKAVGILVAFGSIGAAVLPLLAGQLLEGSTRNYLWFVLVGLGLLPLLLLGTSRLSRTAAVLPPKSFRYNRVLVKGRELDG